MIARTAAELMQELEQRYGPWKNHIALIIRSKTPGPTQLIGPPIWDDPRRAEPERKAKLAVLEVMLREGEAVGFIESHPGGADGFTVRIKISPLREYAQNQAVAEFLSRLVEGLRRNHVVSLRGGC